MKTLIAYSMPTQERHFENDGEIITYLPNLAKEGEAALRAALLKELPDVLVVGNNRVSKETQEAWLEGRKNAGLTGNATVLRRGTSLAEVDPDVEGITRLNTPDVNSSHVAEYMLRELGVIDAAGVPVPGKGKKLAVIGTGGIGGIVARTALGAGYDVTVCSPSVGGEENEENSAALARKGLTAARAVKTAAEAISGADLVAVAAKLNPPYLDQEFANAVPTMNEGAKFASVSELRFFGKDALEALVQRANDGHMTLLLDSGPKDREGHLGGMTLNPDRVKQVSNAMNSLRCQEDMDRAVIISLARLDLQRQGKEMVSDVLEGHLPPGAKASSIAIIGAGIAGLTTAVILQQAGYKVALFDQHDHDVGNREWDGTTTHGGQGVRHFSSTEYMIYAILARAMAMRDGPEKGGFQLLVRNELEPQEQAWANAFTQMCGNVGLHTLCGKLAIDLNRTGMKGWKELMEKSRELFEGVIISERLVRLYPTEAGYNAGLQLQGGANDKIVPLTREETINRFPHFAHAEIHGGIEVDGFGINLHRLVENMEKFLEERQVKVNWKTRVKGLYDREGGGVELKAADGSTIAVADWVLVSTGANANKDGILTDETRDTVQGLMGCWFTIPNIGENGAPLLSEALKLQMADPVGVINVTPLDGNIYFSGGFGYVGERDPDMDSPTVKAFFAKVEEKLKEYFPVQYQMAKEAGTLDPKFCIRPVTADGLPVVQAAGDRIEVMGTGAGGAVQAPVTAMLAAGLLSGQASRYQRMVFDPHRSTLLAPAM